MEKSSLSLRRIFGLIVLFLFFETVVAVLSVVLVPDNNVFVMCALMTALALVVWVVITMVTRTASRPAAAPDPQAPVPKIKTPAGSDAFTQEFRHLMIEANGRLAASPNAAKAVGTRTPKPLVTNLPIYLVAGAPGSGKTSAIVNSGLEPRMLAGEAFRESRVVPTEICNFWLASGAIFVDVSGRVFLDEPHHWETLLRLLTGRERKPLWRRIFTVQRTVRNLRGVVLIHDTKSLIDTRDGETSAAARKNP
jgi:type VI protein secretion system component VasK